MNTRKMIVALVAMSFTAVSIPAIAQASDPESATPAAKAVVAKPELTGRQKSVRICRPESTAPEAKMVCKTRGQWIREGRDPLGVY